MKKSRNLLTHRNVQCKKTEYNKIRDAKYAYAFTSVEKGALIMKYITTEWKNKIAYITINRPPVNALSREVYLELTQAFNNLHDYLDEVSVVILTGKGKHFISGNDIHEFLNLSKAEINEQSFYFANCMTSIFNCPVPVIGAVNGAAVGSGFCVAALCDILVASDQARFGITELKLGLLGGIPFLNKMIPSKADRYMAYTGKLISAEEMHSYGSVHSVVPAEKLMDAAENVADEILQCPPLALHLGKHVFNILDGASFLNGDFITDMLVLDLIQTEDTQESFRAFLEKRKPVYKRR